MSVYDVPIDKLLKNTSEELKKIEVIIPPDWAQFVKTGMAKDRPPVQEDWWYMRAASILRKIMIQGPVGVSKLRTKYGSKKNRGARPEKFFRASGNIIRKILQQLEKAELVKKAEKTKYKGRIITPTGSKLLGKVSSEIMKEEGTTFEKKVRIEPEKRKRKVTKKRVTRKRTTKKKTTKKRVAKKKVVVPETKEVPIKEEPKSVETKEQTEEKKE